VDLEREASLVGEEVGVSVGVGEEERSLQQGREEQGRSMLAGGSSSLGLQLVPATLGRSRKLLGSY